MRKNSIQPIWICLLGLLLACHVIKTDDKSPQKSVIMAKSEESKCQYRHLISLISFFYSLLPQVLNNSSNFIVYGSSDSRTTLSFTNFLLYSTFFKAQKGIVST